MGLALRLVGCVERDFRCLCGVDEVGVGDD